MSIIRKAKQWFMAEPIGEDTGEKGPPAAAQSTELWEEGPEQEEAGPDRTPDKTTGRPVRRSIRKPVRKPIRRPDKKRAGRDYDDSRLPALLLHAGGIHSYREYDRIFRRLSSPEFWITTLFELALILLLVLYKEELITLLDTYLPAGGSHGIEIIRIAINALTLLLIVHLFIRGIGYSAAVTRRRQLRMLFGILESRGYFTREEVGEVLKNLFGNEKLFY